MYEDAIRRLLDLDRDVAPNQVVELLARPGDRGLAPPMSPALGPDRHLGMDELAHRRRVALTEGGQEAASELFGLLRRQLPAT